MRETFSEYKKTLELNLIRFNYLYSGDVISHISSSYSEIRNNDLRSPTFIINSIVNIYNESINNMISRSNKTIILEHKKIFQKNNIYSGYNILSELDKMGIQTTYHFYPDIEMFKRNISNGSFPSYFYSDLVRMSKYFLRCPLIDEDEVVIYATDAAIQSLVYSIQNMEYIIEYNNHIMKYDLYDCKYNSYKIIIRDISKYRDVQINKILNDV